MATKPPAPTLDWDALVDVARATREHAYAPYSSYQVGAAILASSGRTYAGCNVENASFGGTICAERGAIMQMVASGDRTPAALVVVTRGTTPASPCGICRQVLVEFAPDLPILLVGVDGAEEVREFTSLGELLPRAFRGAALTTQKLP